MGGMSSPAGVVGWSFGRGWILRRQPRPGEKPLRPMRGQNGGRGWSQKNQPRPKLCPASPTPVLVPPCGSIPVLTHPSLSPNWSWPHSGLGPALVFRPTGPGLTPVLAAKRGYRPSFWERSLCISSLESPRTRANCATVVLLLRYRYMMSRTLWSLLMSRTPFLNHR